MIIRYGNRRFDEANTTTLPKNCGTSPNWTVCPADVPVVNPSVNQTNNRLNGYTFDNAGNTTKDAQSRKFTYDGENKQIKVETVDANGNPTSTIGEYFYDGDGKRVKKYVPSTGETTIFVYNAGGQLVAEYSTQISQTPQVSYLTTDHLGSPRINTDQNGAVTARHDYQPFGEEITRASYGADTVRKQFATYERDKETDLDFAQARMYANKLGRFTTPDIVAGEMTNPQSLNRYLYVWNNPLRLTDPTGMVVEWEDSKKKKKKGETEAMTNAEREYKNHLEKMINSDDPDERAKGEKLKAEYDRLNNSDIVFHVVNEAADSSSGELGYKGQKGHLYVSLKGDSSAYGELTTIQKLAHEFKHGTQFLDGKFAFRKDADGKWQGFANDLYDESEAMIAGFEAESINGFQKSNNPGYRAKNSAFFQALDGALPKGQGAVIEVMKNNGGSPYKNYSEKELDLKTMPKSEGYYGIPK